MRSGIRITAAAAGIFLAAWLGFRYLLPLVWPFALGAGLALLAEPMTKLLCTRLRLKRPLATGISVSATFFFLAILFLLLCAFLVRELGILAGVLPNLEDTAVSGIHALEGWLLNLADRAPGSIRTVLSRNVTEFFSGGTALLERATGYLLGLAGNLLTQVPDSALTLGTAVISGYMISAKLPKIRLWIAGKLPKTRLRPVLDTLKRMKNTVFAWLLAQMKLSGVTFLILTAAFLLLRVSYAPLWAFLTALVDAFPVLGTGAVLIPWSIVCLLQGNTARGIGLISTYAVAALTRSVLEPKLVGKQLGLDPLFTLAALYAGYKLWGIGGMILAPMLAVTAAQLVSGKRRDGPLLDA